MIWGSISLATALLQERLIDEIQLRVVPTAIGAAKPTTAVPKVQGRRNNWDSIAMR